MFSTVEEKRLNNLTVTFPEQAASRFGWRDRRSRWRQLPVLPRDLLRRPRFRGSLQPVASRRHQGELALVRRLPLYAARPTGNWFVQSLPLMSWWKRGSQWCNEMTAGLPRYPALPKRSYVLLGVEVAGKMELQKIDLLDLTILCWNKPLDKHSLIHLNWINKLMSKLSLCF